jgi:hypothetical protein
VASASARQRLYYDRPSCVLTAVEVEEDEMRMVSRRLSLAGGGGGGGFGDGALLWQAGSGGRRRLTTVPVARRMSRRGEAPFIRGRMAL